MSDVLRIVLVAASGLSLLYVINKIRHSQMQIEYSLFWIILSVIMLVMAVFPQMVYWVATKLRMISPANFVFLFIIATLLLKTFMMTIEISRLEQKVKDLAQQVALDEKEQRDEMEEIKREKEA